MHIACAEPLLSRNSLALPATARAYAEVETTAELGEALEWAVARKMPVVPLGEGSNVVLAGDLDALVLRIRIRGLDILDSSRDSVLLRVAAGENWHRFVEWSLEQGYNGVENLALIPGTVGAAPIQNIGAYGIELAPLVEAVHALQVTDGSAITLSRRDCEFAYRDSVFKHRLRDRQVITAVDLRLSCRGGVNTDYPVLARYLEQCGQRDPTPAEVCRAVMAIRRDRLPDPALEPNAGSFFKNPVISMTEARSLQREFPEIPLFPAGDDADLTRAKLPAAWLIERCGWKGVKEGAVGIHPEHALVVVNYGGGDGSQVLHLAERIARSVEERFGVQLEIEPRVYGA